MAEMEFLPCSIYVLDLLYTYEALHSNMEQY